MYSIPEKICLMAWDMSWQDGTDSESNATEKEKNLVRAARKFFQLDTDTFNSAFARKKSDNNGFYEDLGKSDPLTQIASLYLSLKVAFSESEDSSKESNLSDKEWEWFKKKLELYDLPYFKVRTDIKNPGYAVINAIADTTFLKDNELIELALMEKEMGTINGKDGIIEKLLNTYFKSLLDNKLLVLWEEHYKRLIRDKYLLEECFGPFDTNALKSQYSRLKESIKAHKAIQREAAAEAKRKEREAAAEAKRKEREEQIRKKNEAHEFKSSRGETFCKFCGKGDHYGSSPCDGRVNKHSYKHIKDSYGNWEIKCGKCGQYEWYSNSKCY